MKVPSYLQRALEPWTGEAGPVDFDAELEKLQAASASLLARGHSSFERSAPPSVVGESAASSTTTYDRSSGQAAYAVRGGAGLPAEKELSVTPDDDDLLDPGELSPEEEAARSAALAELEPDEKEERGFLERAAWRNYKANRARSRTENSRTDFANREEMVVARRFDDMYRRNADDFEFEVMWRDSK